MQRACGLLLLTVHSILCVPTVLFAYTDLGNRDDNVDEDEETEILPLLCNEGGLAL